MSPCKIWGIVLGAPAVGAKMGVCIFVVCLSRSRPPARCSFKRCIVRTCIVSQILMLFWSLFLKRQSFEMHYIFVIFFVARWRHNCREIEVKNCEKSKNRQKSLCAPLRIYSSQIWTKFYRSSLGPRTQMCTYIIIFALRYVVLAAT